ncbi:MAG: FAD-binding oxidoreductase [Hyphomicrobiales bacterium]|nr:FAD-binding oxidoreductase [Hyphomicrobiales bacterium]
MVDVNTPASADIVIVGGAVMGSSVAYHLASNPNFKGRVVVIEKDPTYTKCASALSAASIRQQFSTEVNIKISLYGISFLRNISQHLSIDGEAPSIDLHEGGYLYLETTPGAPVLTNTHQLQTALGADIVLYDQSALKQKFPWLFADDVVAASWGRTGEGWFDGWGLMQAFRKKARHLGVTYIEGEVIQIERSGGRIEAVILKDGSRIACGAVLNTAGASGGRALAALAGLDIPVHAKKRCVFSFHCKGDVTDAPLLIDPTGTWCRPEGKRSAEGQQFICGGSPGEEDPDSQDFEVDWSLFEDIYWPSLAARSPAFEQIKPGRAWAGHYDMCALDHNAIIGRAMSYDNFYLANGFSGHGLQQSPAIGRGLAELLIHGTYQTLDLSALGHARVVENKPLHEANVI